MFILLWLECTHLVMATSNRIKLKSFQTALLNIKSSQSSNGLYSESSALQHFVESMPPRIKAALKAKEVQPGTSEWPVCVFCRYWWISMDRLYIWYDVMPHTSVPHLIAPAALFHILTEPLKHNISKERVFREEETDVEHNVSLGWIGNDARLILFIKPGEMQQR